MSSGLASVPTVASRSKESDACSTKTVKGRIVSDAAASTISSETYERCKRSKAAIAAVAEREAQARSRIAKVGLETYQSDTKNVESVTLSENDCLASEVNHVERKKSAKSGSQQTTGGYQPPTVESVLDSSAEFPTREKKEDSVDGSDNGGDNIDKSAVSDQDQHDTSTPVLPMGKNTIADDLGQKDGTGWTEARSVAGTISDPPQGRQSVRSFKEENSCCSDSRHFSPPTDGGSQFPVQFPGQDTNGNSGRPIQTPCSPRYTSSDCRRPALDSRCANHHHAQYLSSHQCCSICHYDRHDGGISCACYPLAWKNSHCNEHHVLHTSENAFGTSSFAGSNYRERQEPEKVHVPRTFSVHTASPSVASDRHNLGGQNTVLPCKSLDDDRDEELDAWLAGEPLHKGYGDEIPLSEGIKAATYDDENGYGEDSRFAANYMGESIPPYNFDLFSERSHSRERSPFPPLRDDGNGGRTSFSTDQKAGYGHYSKFRGGSSNSSNSNRSIDAVIPDYNFDLFSDVTNHWNPDEEYDSASDSYGKGRDHSRNGKGTTAFGGDVDENVNVYHRTRTATAYLAAARKRENTDSARTYQGNASVSSRRTATTSTGWKTEKKAAAYASPNSRSRPVLSSGSRKVSLMSHTSFEIEECEDDDDSKSTRHIVDCEVISNPDSISDCDQSEWSNRARIGHDPSPQ